MNINANGSTAKQATTPNAEYVAVAQGTFGGGSLALEFSLDNGVTWSPITDSNGAVAWTSSNACVFVAPAGHARFTLSGATSPSIVAYISA